MKAMILAAGLGTRLKPLTDNKPKALVDVNGVPMLERIILKLKSQGFTYIVVNVHHFAEQIIEFLRNRDYGLKIEISDESNTLLDTGGGIVKAFDLLFGHDNEPVLIHNVDIISNAELGKMIEKSGDLAQLLVSERTSTRKLIFDNEMRLTGWHDINKDLFRPSYLKEVYNKFTDKKKAGLKEYAFSGIYIMPMNSVIEMKRLLGENKYSVTEYFLNEGRKQSIMGYLQSDLKIIDIGKPATLLQAQNWDKF